MMSVQSPNVQMVMTKYLKEQKMNQDLYLFRKVKASSLVEEAMEFDPNTLGSLETLTVSKYSIALAQYLVYFKSEVNQTKAILAKKRKLFDTSLSLSLDPATLKKFKTKTAATEFLVSTVPNLSALDGEMDVLKQELVHLDGMDKSISEYIATFKRELTRREQELFTIRAERRM